MWTLILVFIRHLRRWHPFSEEETIHPACDLETFSLSPMYQRPSTLSWIKGLAINMPPACVYVWAHVCTEVSMYICSHICVLSINVCVYVYMYIDAFVSLCAHMCMPACVCICWCYAFVYCGCMCIHVHIWMNICVCICVHVWLCVHMSMPLYGCIHK